MEIMNPNAVIESSGNDKDLAIHKLCALANYNQTTILRQQDQIAALRMQLEKINSFAHELLSRMEARDA